MGKGTTTATTGTGTIIIRYAPYVEALHQDYVASLQADEAAAVNPFSGYTEIDIDAGFFGVGYTLGSYPSLFDMFGKFMAGLDIDALFDEIFTDTEVSDIVKNVVAQESDLLDDDINQIAIPRFETGMRDMNAVMSSSFVIGKSLIEDAKVKALARFSADLQRSLIPVATERWRAHLDWNKGVIAQYVQMVKTYVDSKLQDDEFYLGIQNKGALWPFTLLEYERAAIGALAQPQQTNTSNQSTTTMKQQGGVLGSILGGLGAAASFL